MGETKYVVFKLGPERYGLPIEYVERILPAQNVTRLPRTPKVLLGVFDLRGATVPALDAWIRFGLEKTTECKNFVVVTTPEGRCALSVENVDGIVSLRDDQIEPPGALAKDESDPFLSGIGKQNEVLTVLLDPAHVVPKELRKRVATVAAPVAA